MTGLAAALEKAPSPGSADPRAIDRVTKTTFAPIALLESAQWVAWKLAERHGKRTKIPVNPRTGGNAAADNPATWDTYEAAMRAVSRFDLAGVGYVFTDTDPFSGVDLDDCRNPETGEIQQWAWEIIHELNSYAEVSPSKTGVKIWVRGKLAPGARNRTTYQNGEVEMYSRKRYFTVTGHHLEGTPTTIEERQAELVALHSRIFGPRNEGKRALKVARNAGPLC